MLSWRCTLREGFPVLSGSPFSPATEDRPSVASIRCQLRAKGRAPTAQGGPLIDRRSKADLAAENVALRRELAKLQGVQPDEVTYSIDSIRQKNETEEEPEPSPPAPGIFPTLDLLQVSLQELEAGINWPSTSQDAFWEQLARSNLISIGGASSSTAPEKDAKALQVVHMAAEMAPIAKVGGLGDVVTGLARACIDRGHAVQVLLPFYESLPDDQIGGLQHAHDFDCPKGRVWDGVFQTGVLRTQAFKGTIEGIPVVLLRPDWGKCNIFKGSAIYGGSYMPMLYWEAYHAALPQSRIMLTIHNMDNSGECRQDEFAFTGLSGDAFATVDRALDERTIGHNPERLCLMKGGIVYSNIVTTVSPTYASEALTGSAAGWLRATLAKPEVRSKFKGVLNGIDTALWDPAKDPLLAAPFTADQLDGKSLCKRYLQRGLGLKADPEQPIVACITRLVPQKGIRLIRHAIYRTSELGGQFVLLGSGHADGEFRSLATTDFKDSDQVKIMVMYSEALAHQIYAAADIILVPSLYEPCGLTQLVGMRYGAIPVVRSTGGLADTVTDIDLDPETGNGFCFVGIDDASLDSALDRALNTFREAKSRWKQLSRRNMRLDWSWQRC
ncbi:g738 [Coccomyxa viridis]|uniref:Starch synthase, chloroplastic/amyloplastic n=1 Tax=Coccomyxa viridis TaxID=1274662 RepID=A0ABP1FLP7_9CHLO